MNNYNNSTISSSLVNDDTHMYIVKDNTNKRKVKRRNNSCLSISKQLNAFTGFTTKHSNTHNVNVTIIFSSSNNKNNFTLSDIESYEQSLTYIPNNNNTTTTSLETKIIEQYDSDIYFKELTKEFNMPFISNPNDPFYITHSSQTLEQVNTNILAYSNFINTISHTDNSTYANLPSTKIKQIIYNNSISPTTLSLPNNNITHIALLNLIALNSISFLTLTYINLSHNPLNDSGGCYLFHLLLTFNTCLSNINISYTLISSLTIELLCKFISTNVSPLHTLNISGNSIPDTLFNDILLSISNSNDFKCFISRDNNIGTYGAMMLGNTLRYDNMLKIVDISGNKCLGGGDVEIIMKGLAYNRSVKVFIMNDLDIGNKGLNGLIEYITRNKELEVLFMERNGFNKRGMCLIKELITNNKGKLKYIGLDGNDYKIKDIQCMLGKDIISKEKYIVDTRLYSEYEDVINSFINS